MQAAGWIDLFRKLPPKLHDTLALGMTTGMEVVVQHLLHFDDDFMVIRGRTSGTNDAGRIVVLPYAHLVSVAFNRPLAATEVHAMFGITDFVEQPGASANNGDGADGHAEAAAAAVPPPSMPAPVAHLVAPPPKGPLSKTVLLKRLRERLAGKSANGLGAGVS